MTITGIFVSVGSAAIASRTPAPSSTGIMKSRKISSGCAFFHQIQTLSAVDRQMHLMALLAEHITQQFANSELIIDDGSMQNRGVCSGYDRY
jgi:hypothetical protein